MFLFCFVFVLFCCFVLFTDDVNVLFFLRLQVNTKSNASSRGGRGTSTHLLTELLNSHTSHLSSIIGYLPSTLSLTLRGELRNERLSEEGYQRLCSCGYDLCLLQSRRRLVALRKGMPDALTVSAKTLVTSWRGMPLLTTRLTTLLILRSGRLGVRGVVG